MTAPVRPRSPRNSDLARIHMGAVQLGLIRSHDDSAYRDMLWAVARVRSARDLDHRGRALVIQHLASCGAGIGGKRRRPPGRRGQHYDPSTQAALIRHLWTMLAAAGAIDDADDRALRRWLATHAQEPGARVDAIGEIAPQHLDRAGANRAIEQLKSWCGRLGITDQMIRNGEIPTPRSTP